MVGLKLANTLIDGGNVPSALAGAVKWPAVTITRSRISVPLANPRSSTGFPRLSTRQTMMTPTLEYLFSRSTAVCAEIVVGPHHRAAVPAIAATIHLLEHRITKPSVPVAMVDVVDVGVAMSHRFMTMPVGMGRLRQLVGRVLVLMVLVVVMLVGVLQGLVLM